HQADADARYHVGDGHTGVHQSQASAAGRRHRTRTVGFEDVRNHADGVREIIDDWQDCHQGPLSQGPVADFTPARAADRTHFTDAVAGEVVVQVELLAVFFGQAVHNLLVRSGAQCDG